MTVNIVVLAGTVAADPVQRRMPSGDEVPELSAVERSAKLRDWLESKSRLDSDPNDDE